jgi:hypothetical protein
MVLLKIDFNKLNFGLPIQIVVALCSVATSKTAFEMLLFFT